MHAERINSKKFFKRAEEIIKFIKMGIKKDPITLKLTKDIKIKIKVGNRSFLQLGKTTRPKVEFNPPNIKGGKIGITVIGKKMSQNFSFDFKDINFLHEGFNIQITKDMRVEFRH